MLAAKETPANVPVDLRAHGQPEFHAMLEKANRLIIDGQMLAHQPNFTHGLKQVSFQVEDLIGVRRDPSAAMQFFRKRTIAGCVGQKAGSAVGTLLEAHLPCRLSCPLAQTLTCHAVLAGEIRMEN